MLAGILNYIFFYFIKKIRLGISCEQAGNLRVKCLFLRKIQQKYFRMSSAAVVIGILRVFVLDSHLATLWESNCPFGFLLMMFPLGSSYFVFVFLSL